MAFNESNLSVIGGESSEGPSIYAYYTSGDDVSVDMYFDSKFDTFKQNDIIKTTDGTTLKDYVVTASGSLSAGVDISLLQTASSGAPVNSGVTGTVSVDIQNLGELTIVNTNTSGADIDIEIEDVNTTWAVGDTLDFYWQEYPSTAYGVTLAGRTGAANFYYIDLAAITSFTFVDIGTYLRLISRGGQDWNMILLQGNFTP